MEATSRFVAARGIAPASGIIEAFFSILFFQSIFERQCKGESNENERERCCDINLRFNILCPRIIRDASPGYGKHVKNLIEYYYRVENAVDDEKIVVLVVEAAQTDTGENAHDRG